MKTKVKNYLFPLLMAIFLICASSAIFIFQVNKTIEKNTLSSITELAKHDLSSIFQFLESKWLILRNLEKKFNFYNFKTINQIQEQFNIERKASDFKKIFFIDEDNIIYADDNVIYRDNEINLLQKLTWQDRKSIVRRFDYVGKDGEQEELLIFAIKVDNCQVQNKKITTFVALIDIDSFKNRLIIYNFKDEKGFHGYSSIVNPQGEFIVNFESLTTSEQERNLFTILDRGITTDRWTSKMISDKMNDREEFFFDYIDSTITPKLLYFFPIENTTWYFISVVEREVFKKQLNNFLVMSISMVVVALIIFSVMLFMVLRSRVATLRAKAETKARSEFLSNMSHEIRTPLNGIIGLLYLLKNQLKKGDYSQMGHLIDKSNDTAEYLLSLVSDILDISKFHAEKLKLEPEPFMLDKMLYSVFDMQKDNIEANGLKFEMNCNITTPAVIGDETRIKQVLMNIVGNAIKFTPAGGKITISAEQMDIVDNHVVTTISCADTGIGMSEEFLKTIWDSFSQEHNKLANGMRGTGLGMAISKAIMDAMYGTISVKSKLEEGSTFTIEFALPITVEAVKADEELYDAIDDQKIVEDFKLLVVDDNELNAEILKEILESKGFNVDIAENGTIAVHMFERSSMGEYFAILMDMQMPVMDGCEAASKIRQSSHPDAKSIKIFACTANVFQEDKKRAISSGMNDFLIKPIDIDLLMQKLLVEL